MSAAADLNRRKVGKWIWQLVLRFQTTAGLRAALQRSPDGTISARIFTASPSHALRFVAGTDGARLIGPDEQVLVGFADRELRTKDVIPWFEERVRAWLRTAPPGPRPDLARTHTVHAVGLLLAHDSALIAEGAAVLEGEGRWQWQNAFLHQRTLVSTKIGHGLFLEDGVVVSDEGDLLDLAAIFTSGLSDEEIIGRLSALVRGESSTTSADARVWRAEAPAMRALFSPLREDEIVFGPPWRRCEFLRGAPQRLPFDGESAAFWSGDGRLALVSSRGQILDWPPSADAKPTKAELSCPDALVGGKGTSIAAGPNTLAYVSDERIRVVRGAPPADGSGWARLAAASTGVEISHPHGALTAIAVDAEGEYLFAVDAGTGAHFGRIDAPRLATALGESPGGHPFSLACAPGRHLMASLGRAIELFDTRERRRVASTPSDIDTKVYAAFDPSERYLAMVFRDVLGVIDMDSLDVRFLLPILRKGLTDYGAPVPVVFSRSGEFLAVGGERVTVYRWSRIAPLIPRMPHLPWALRNEGWKP